MLQVSTRLQLAPNHDSDNCILADAAGDDGVQIIVISVSDNIVAKDFETDGVNGV